MNDVVELLKPFLTSSIRHGLTLVAGYLVGAHVIGSGDSAGFVAAAMTLVGVGWSWWQKVGQQQVADALKKMTAKATTSSAVAAAKVLPAGSAVSPDLPKPAAAAAAAKV